MLEREEIIKIAREKNEQEKIIEKDYFLELLLFVIQENSKELVFKGGTALYKLYNLPRFSEDLDFTLNGKLNSDKFILKLIRSLRQAGASARIKERDMYQNQQNIRLELKGPLFDGNPQNANVISINISLREKPIYKPKEERIYPKYRDIPSFNINCMVAEEMLAEKIRALITRDKARDLYDLWFLLGKGIRAKVKDINKKLKICGGRFNMGKLLERIEDKRKSWEMDLKGLIKGNLPEFSIVKKQVIEKLKKMQQE